MSTFYCIVNSAKKSNQPKNWAYLEAACQKRSVEFVTLVAEDTDFGNLPKLKERAMVYRIGTQPASLLLEKLVHNDSIRNLYRGGAFLERADIAQLGVINGVKLHKSQLPFIDTVFNPSADSQTLRKQTEKLGGFPIILKSAGGSHGAGVMRLDSFESLQSVIGSISNNEDLSRFTLKRYVDYKQHLRLIVLGDKVVDSIEYFKPEGDFRTNAVSEPKVQPIEVDEQAQELAVQATHLLGTNFGGVDILVDEKGSLFVAEVNFPCNFSRNQDTTGKDIAGMIVDYLLEQ